MSDAETNANVARLTTLAEYMAISLSENCIDNTRLASRIDALEAQLMGLLQAQAQASGTSHTLVVTNPVAAQAG